MSGEKFLKVSGDKLSTVVEVSELSILTKIHSHLTPCLDRKLLPEPQGRNQTDWGEIDTKTEKCCAVTGVTWNGLGTRGSFVLVNSLGGWVSKHETLCRMTFVH